MYVFTYNVVRDLNLFRQEVSRGLVYHGVSPDTTVTLE